MIVVYDFKSLEHGNNTSGIFTTISKELPVVEQMRMNQRNSILV